MASWSAAPPPGPGAFTPKRQPLPEDRSKVLVSITDAGRAMLDRYLPEAVAIHTAMLGGHNDGELQTLSELLTRALGSTDGIDPHAVADAAAPRRRGRPSR